MFPTGTQVLGALCGQTKRHSVYVAESFHCAGADMQDKCMSVELYGRVGRCKRAIAAKSQRRW
jgi:hypothetical protein